MGERYSATDDPKMQDLFARAERDGLWFWCNYQDLWFSPAKLREEHARGRFHWGPDNWRLRPPSERVVEAEVRAKAAADDLERVKREVRHG